MDKKGYPKVLELEVGFPCYLPCTRWARRRGTGWSWSIPSEIVAHMREVPYGKVTTLRRYARMWRSDHRVDACCTLTSGIHVMTAANAAAEAATAGEDLDIPYWRTLKIGGYLNRKYPGGIEGTVPFFRTEGFEIIGKGKASRVKDFGSTVHFRTSVHLIDPKGRLGLSYGNIKC